MRFIIRIIRRIILIPTSQAIILIISDLHIFKRRQIKLSILTTCKNVICSIISRITIYADRLSFNKDLRLSCRSAIRDSDAAANASDFILLIR